MEKASSGVSGLSSVLRSVGLRAATAPIFPAAAGCRVAELEMNHYGDATLKTNDELVGQTMSFVDNVFVKRGMGDECETG